MAGTAVKNKIIIGVTGGFSSGKTVAADLFVKKGAFRIDADKIAHEVLKKDKTVKNKLVKIFGKNILSNGRICRKKLGKIVFSNKILLGKLNAVLHPKIIKIILKKAKETKKEIIVLDAPLLIETGLNEYVDIVVMICATRDRQMKWACGKGVAEERTKKIIACQLPMSLKKTFADFVIDNNGEIEKIKKGVERIWQGL